MKGTLRWRAVGAVTAFLLGCAGGAFALDRNDVIGTWEGESTCMVANSPCHDEHVIYEIVGDRRKSQVFKIDAYKLRQGPREFMGSLDCTLNAASSTLSCTGHTAKQDLWEFKIAATHMDGTLLLGQDKQLYRKVSVEKHPLR